VTDRGDMATTDASKAHTNAAAVSAAVALNGAAGGVSEPAAAAPAAALAPTAAMTATAAAAAAKQTELLLLARSARGAAAAALARQALEHPAVYQFAELIASPGVAEVCARAAQWRSSACRDYVKMIVCVYVCVPILVPVPMLALLYLCMFISVLTPKDGTAASCRGRPTSLGWICCASLPMAHTRTIWVCATLSE
jgi:hypothetical protein